MAVMSQTDPPSSGTFHPDLSNSLAGVVGFLHDAGSPFMINPYPFFAYRSDSRSETLAFCLFCLIPIGSTSARRSPTPTCSTRRWMTCGRRSTGWGSLRWRSWWRKRGGRTRAARRRWGRRWTS
ncbi:hypothetical protein Cni_G07514 [Canna indica]|uniref:Uncharacterized protein n=1 Tax=Canna indica TaxID=4628 RepID=A0AAQ3JZ33_9LILI|nr:hypothetical protein Cni_G07514 [Canna indica]